MKFSPEQNASLPEVVSLVLQEQIDWLYSFCLRLTCHQGRAETLTRRTVSYTLDRRDEVIAAPDARLWLLKTCLAFWRETYYVQATVTDGPSLLEKALAQLNNEDRAALLLRVLEGQSYEQIAALMNLAPEQIGEVLRRARLAIIQQTAVITE